MGTLSTGRAGPGPAWFDWPLARPLRASPPLPGPRPRAGRPRARSGPGHGAEIRFFFVYWNLVATTIPTHSLTKHPETAMLSQLILKSPQPSNNHPITN